MICGTALQTLLLLIVLYKTNWNKEASLPNSVIAMLKESLHFFYVTTFLLYVLKENIVLRQVEETTERMRKWGGQEINEKIEA